MRVDIDESRRNNATACINLARRRTLNLANLRNAPIFYSHRSGETRAASPIDDRAIPNNKIEVARGNTPAKEHDDNRPDALGERGHDTTLLARLGNGELLIDRDARTHRLLLSGWPRHFNGIH